MKKIFILLFMFLFSNLYANNINLEIESFIVSFTSKFDIVGNNKDDYYKLARDILDLDWMGNFILGQYRNSLSEEEKRDFIEYYSRYLIKNYLSSLSSYKKGNYKIKEIKETRKNIFNVSMVIDNDSKLINSNLRIVKKDNKYYITDIIIEGVSFISSQRSEISSIISSKGFDNFLKDLKNNN